GVQVVRVETAEEMAREVFDRFPECQAVIMAAAVADFRPARPVEGKFKKDAGPPDLTLEPTVDVLSTLGKRKEHQVLVGFAAETEGHPDKLADQMSDAVLDSILPDDPDGRVACETLLTTGLVLVAGEISTKIYVDVPRVVRETVTGIGYTDAKSGIDGATCG